jgi:DNA invertase Pin-like site-specific DNA recombinase
MSTKDKGQTTENQRRALEQWAANAGCTVVATFEDSGELRPTASDQQSGDRRGQGRYLHSEQLRREIHEGLNVIEQWNGATMTFG